MQVKIHICVMCAMSEEYAVAIKSRKSMEASGMSILFRSGPTTGLKFGSKLSPKLRPSEATSFIF